MELNEIEEMKAFSRKVARIADENKALLATKERYVENAKEIRAIASDLRQLSYRVTEMAKKIDPFTRMGVASESNNPGREHIAEVCRELYEKMQAGTHVTIDLIKSTYGTVVGSAQYIMLKLVKMPNVTIVKDGKKRRLFVNTSIGGVI